MNMQPTHKIWWTAEEIALACLPGLPVSAGGVAKLAKRQNWRKAEGAVQRRKGRGGGVEFHFRLFPVQARDYLAAQGMSAVKTPEERDEAGLWTEYELLKQTAKDKALARLSAVQSVHQIARGGVTLSYAVSRVAAAQGKSERSIWNWVNKCQGVSSDNWLPVLAGRHATAHRKVNRAEFCESAWDVFKASFLRPEQPTFEDCYRDLCMLANEHRWTVPSLKTVQRVLSRRIPKAVQVLAREGRAGLDALYPAQVRDKSMLTALSAVDADFHKFDVFVNWDGEIIRPQLSAIRDIYSGKLLAWRLAQTPNSATVLLTIGDLVEDYGIPNDFVIDNGREYAAKWITGGVENRYRFKVKADDPLGVLPQLGVEVHFTTPYHGQAKPVERLFRDYCSNIAKDIRFAGAYVGNKPDAKPENYGSRAIDRDVFTRVLAERIVGWNLLTGRRAPTCEGRSFDETFNASYETAPVRKASKEQRRLWLLGAEGLRGHRTSGELTFMGNKYWSEWSPEIAGQKVVGRFDPEDLHGGLHVYALTGEYLGFANCNQAVGFFDVEGGKNFAREKNRWRRAQRELLKAEQKLTPAQVGDLLNSANSQTSELDLSAKVVAPEFGRKAPADVMARPAKPEPKPLTDTAKAIQTAQIAQFRKASAASTETPAPETAVDRFRRCVAIQTSLAKGENVGAAEAAWAGTYKGSSEYAAQERMERYRQKFEQANEK